MRRIVNRLVLLTGTLLAVLMLQGCGQDKGASASGESFAAAADSEAAATLAAESAQPSASPQTLPTVTAAAAAERSPVAAATAAATSLPDQAPATAEAGPAATASPAGGAASSAPSAEAGAAPAKKASPAPSPSAVPTAGPKTAQPAANNQQAAGTATAAANPVATPPATPSPSAAANSVAEVTASGNTVIDWNGFFDGEDQTRPSERFWDLSGSQVTIKGFMGEVLSFEKNWFLLIPEPGAECPFDNGDETYWNKIMIVFVPKSHKLRYTAGPMELTGRLDVGIKIDESGYKTMFRLYDASYKSL